jgi:hypothetical protein
LNAAVSGWLAAAVIVALGGFFAGRALHSETGNAGAYDADAPSFEPAPAIAGFSPGGFSGFGEVPGFEGTTVLAGRIISADATSIVMESTAGVRSTVRLQGDKVLQVIRPADHSELRAGSTVVVRMVDGGEEAASVLIVAEP